MRFAFFDTEFTGFASPKIMSIGLVDIDGDKLFYAETYDSWEMKDCSSFVKTDVLPMFSGGTFSIPMKETALRLSDWINSFDEPVGMVTDSPQWDWMMLISLFERTNTPLPENMVKYHFWLHEVYPDLSVIHQDDWDEALHSGWPQGYRRHHALDDAMVNRLHWFDGYKAIEDSLTKAEFKVAEHPSESLIRKE